jgi:hypothetical protein
MWYDRSSLVDDGRRQVHFAKRKINTFRLFHQRGIMQEEMLKALN